jgi:hypothetical protein
MPGRATKLLMAAFASVAGGRAFRPGGGLGDRLNAASTVGQ